VFNFFDLLYNKFHNISWECVNQFEINLIHNKYAKKLNIIVYMFFMTENIWNWFIFGKKFMKIFQEYSIKSAVQKWQMWFLLMWTFLAFHLKAFQMYRGPNISFGPTFVFGMLCIFCFVKNWKFFFHEIF